MMAKRDDKGHTLGQRTETCQSNFEMFSKRPKSTKKHDHLC